MVINKRKIIKRTILTVILLVFSNIIFSDLIHSRYYNINNSKGCSVYKDKSIKELDDFLSDTSAYTKYEVANFIAKCKNKNIAIILYKNLNLKYSEIDKNPIDVFELTPRKKYLGYTRYTNTLLINLFDLNLDYRNLNEKQRRYLVEVFCPKKLKEEFNIVVEPIILDDLSYLP